MLRRALFAILMLLSPWQPIWAAEPPRSPEEQQKLFHLPPGFEIQLVVSEPQIGQPMNLNFDARGRLWITSSVEYPYPANGEGVQPRPPQFAGTGEHAPRDWVTVVDIGSSGRGENVQKFVSGLNIPIGQTPLGDGNEAIIYSIPNIDKMVDQDGDGQADQRTKLYGTIGNVDTHGMASSFTPWIDGWIYGCHGFTNKSEIVDGQGNTTRLTSGNTYRFRADGSRFEQFTHGQVNPFGMTFDPLGNLYDADCHTMPVYMLLRGGLYPHFGSKPDALGFGPKMINHNHGSTGICGPAYYADVHFPKSFRDNLFICNPVSRVVHRDRLNTFGSTYQVDTQANMVTCDDTWFRPVDAMMGPDGCLYIADFYNPVIGHYEEPLNHPDRDRTHGRVWRIVYTGEEPSAQPLQAAPDLTKLDLPDLVQILAHPNLLVRTMATNRLVGHFKQSAVEPATKLLQSGTAVQKAHALWILERLAGLSEQQLRGLVSDADRLPRVHAIKALAERDAWSGLEGELARSALADEDAFVRRAAADALGQHPEVQHVQPLLTAWAEADVRDTHLNHTLRLALRAHFRVPDIAAALDGEDWTPGQHGRLLEMALVSEAAPATQWLVRNIDPTKVESKVLRQVARQLARSGKAAEITQIKALAANATPWQQVGLLREVAATEAEMGRKPAENVTAKAWAEEIAAQLAPVLSARDTNTDRPLADLITIIENYRLTSTVPYLIAGATNHSLDATYRVAAAAAVVSFGHANEVLSVLAEVATASNVERAAKIEAIRALGRINSEAARRPLLESLKSAPAAWQLELALALSQNESGANTLLDAVDRGEASAYLLQNPKWLQQVLRQGLGESLRERVLKLTAHLPPLEGQIEELIAKRIDGFAAAPHSIEAGAKSFEKHCASCHRIGEQGKLVGPQLDGIGNRGLARVVEDVLDPSRNVDAAFRTVLIQTTDGQVLSALPRREEGEVMVVADGEGKEIRVAKEDIEDQRISPLSLMPANFGEQIPETEFFDLLTYLMGQKLVAASSE